MLATAAAFAGRRALSGLAQRALGSLFGNNEEGGSMKCGAALQQGAKRAIACETALHKGWGADWKQHKLARRLHQGLVEAAEKHAGVLVGKGLTKWKNEAVNHVRRAKRGGGFLGPLGWVVNKIRGLQGGSTVAGGVDIQRAIGSPPNRFGVQPCVPFSTPERTEAAPVQARSYNDYINTTTHGRGANIRNSVGMPFNIDAFRRPTTSRTRGGALMSSGVNGEDTLPDRSMKSGLELEAEFPVEQTCDVIHNFGGNDATMEDTTNYGLRKNPSSGMKLFKTR